MRVEARHAVRLLANDVGGSSTSWITLGFAIALVAVGGVRSLGLRYERTIAGLSETVLVSSLRPELQSTASEPPSIASELPSIASSTLAGVADPDAAAFEFQTSSVHGGGPGATWRRAQALLTIGLGSYGIYGLLTGVALSGALSVVLPVVTFAYGAGILWSQYHPRSFQPVFEAVKDMARSVTSKFARASQETSIVPAHRVDAGRVENHQGSAWEQLKGFVGFSVGTLGLYSVLTGAAMSATVGAVVSIGAVVYGLGVLWSELHPKSFHTVVDPIWNFAKNVGNSLWSAVTGFLSTFSLSMTSIGSATT